jgi:hypothetical protein
MNPLTAVGGISEFQKFIEYQEEPPAGKPRASEQ